MSSVAPTRRQLRGPVDITFVVRDAQGYILGSEVSSHLRHLSMVEFSYYLGYPVQQIAERESDLQASYINNNCSHLMYRLLYEYDGDDFFRQQHFTTLNWTPHSCYALHGWRQVMYANKLVSAYLAPVMRLGQIWAHWLLLRKCYIQSWWLKSENYDHFNPGKVLMCTQTLVTHLLKSVFWVRHSDDANYLHVVTITLSWLADCS